MSVDSSVMILILGNELMSLSTLALTDIYALSRRGPVIAFRVGGLYAGLRRFKASFIDGNSKSVKVCPPS
jgi:hypothetical protein